MLGCEGTSAGHRLDHDCNGAKCLWPIFPLRDLIIFRQLSKASSRDYDHLNCFVLPKTTNMQHGPLLKATSGVTLGVQV